MYRDIQMELTKSNLKSSKALAIVGQTLLILFALSVFLFSIVFLSGSFQTLSGSSLESIIYATSNPFIGLFIGLLLTAVIQSSSTSTSMIVAIVATGTLSIHQAVPMVLGANIGTTLTSSLVALGFIANKQTFRRAISAGVVHDFYNIFLVMILLPLELMYGLLSKPAMALGHLVGKFESTFSENISLSLLGWMSSLSKAIIEGIGTHWIVVIISFIILFLSIKFLSWIIYRRLIGNSRKKFKNYLFKNNFKSFTSGLLITSAVQSSSITTSLVVPLVANRTVSLKKCYPFIIGANVGTTITALIASLFKNEAAISIAIIHFGINSIGAILFLATPLVKNIPLITAKAFSRKIQKYRYIGFLYIILVFFILPFSLIYFNKSTINNTDNIKNKEKNHSKNESETLQIMPSDLHIISLTGKSSNISPGHYRK